MSNQTYQIDEVLDEVREFLPNLVEACESVADKFYEKLTDDTWKDFGEVVQGIDGLYRTLQQLLKQLYNVNSHTFIRNYIDKFVPSVADSFGQLNARSDAEDYVSTADIIKYELVKAFRELAIFLGDSEAQKSQRFELNMKFIKDRFPHVYKELANCSIEVDRYQIANAKDGSSNLWIRGDDNDHVTYYSQYDPRYEANHWVRHNSPAIMGKANILLYGFGFGYHLERLTDTYKLNQCYVYEPDIQIFLAAMQAVELEPLFARSNIRHLAVGKDKDTVEKFFYHFLKYAKGATAVVSLPIYDRIGIEQKAAFSEYANSATTNYAYAESFIQNVGLQLTQNVLYNMAVNMNTPSLLGMKDKMKGVTAVIVGAGPSLEADIDSLRKLQDHVLIIAAGTSIQSLTHFGIKPHLIVSFDGEYANYLAFSHLDTKDIPFLYAPQIEHRIIENRHTNLMHVFLANDMVTQVLMGVTQEDAVFASNLSVTGIAIQAAVFMGCERIIFTGQDLSYPTKSVYAPGAKHVDDYHRKYIDSIAQFTVENVQGGVNRTTEGMLYTLKDIEELLASKLTTKFINASRLGAKIAHTEFMPMEEMVDELRRQEMPSNFFKEALNQYLSAHDPLRVQTAASRVSEMNEMMNPLREKAVRIQRQLRKLPELSRSKPLKCLNIMVEIEQDWESIVKSLVFNVLYNTVIRKEISEFDRNVSDVANETNVVRKAELFCNVLGPVIEAVLVKTPVLEEYIGEAQKRIAARDNKSVSEVAL